MSIRIFLRTVIGAFLLRRKPSSFFRRKKQDLANNEVEAEHYFAVDAKRVCLLWLQLYTVMVSLCFDVTVPVVLFSSTQNADKFNNVLAVLFIFSFESHDLFQHILLVNSQCTLYSATFPGLLYGTDEL